MRQFRLRPIVAVEEQILWLVDFEYVVFLDARADLYVLLSKHAQEKLKRIEARWSGEAWIL